jgi:putative sterol carrier protein
MSVRPFTPAWADAFRAAIEANAAYREAGAKWTWPMAFVLDAAPEFGYAESVAVELALDRGHCHGAVIMSPDAVTAPFVLSAPYATWKRIATGELDPIVAVTRGLLKVRGAITTLMLHARAATALCACARDVATAFPDED